MRRALTALAPLLLCACRSHVAIEFLEPARVTIDPTVRVLAPVDRARDGLSREALDTLVDLLAGSGRFRVVEPAAAAAAFADQPGLAGLPLSAEVARGVCAATRADGIVVLESLSAEPTWSERQKDVEHVRTEEYVENGETKTREVREEYTVFEATLHLRSPAFWSTYDCNARILDSAELLSDQEVVGEGETPALARAAIRDQNALHYSAAHEVAERYAHRIAPLPSSVLRPFFRSGSPGIREGAKAAAAGDWARAAAAWERARQESDGKDRGRALFNLAVATEVRGDLAAALDLATRADNLLGSGVSARYVAALQRRIKQQQRVDRQLGR